MLFEDVRMVMALGLTASYIFLIMPSSYSADQISTLCKRLGREYFSIIWGVCEQNASVLIRRMISIIQKKASIPKLQLLEFCNSASI